MNTRKEHHLRSPILWNCGILVAQSITLTVDSYFIILYMVCLLCLSTKVCRVKMGKVKKKYGIFVWFWIFECFVWKNSIQSIKEWELCLLLWIEINTIKISHYQPQFPACPFPFPTIVLDEMLMKAFMWWVHQLGSSPIDLVNATYTYMLIVITSPCFVYSFLCLQVLYWFMT